MTELSPIIAIIGGGLAGLTLSIGLTRHGIKHKIYEAAAEFSEIGAGIAMGPNAIGALTLIDQRIRDCYDRCATYNESEDLRDTWVSATHAKSSFYFRENLKCQLTSRSGWRPWRCCESRALLSS